MGSSTWRPPPTAAERDAQLAARCAECEKIALAYLKQVGGVVADSWTLKDCLKLHGVDNGEQELAWTALVSRGAVEVYPEGAHTWFYLPGMRETLRKQNAEEQQRQRKQPPPRKVATLAGAMDAVEGSGELEAAPPTFTDEREVPRRWSIFNMLAPRGR